MGRIGWISLPGFLLYRSGKIPLEGSEQNIFYPEAKLLTFNHDFIQQIILSAYYGADARRCWYIIVTMLDAVPGLVEESLVKKVGTHM